MYLHFKFHILVCSLEYQNKQKKEMSKINEINNCLFPSEYLFGAISTHFSHHFVAIKKTVNLLLDPMELEWN